MIWNNIHYLLKAFGDSEDITGIRQHMIILADVNGKYEQMLLSNHIMRLVWANIQYS